MRVPRDERARNEYLVPGDTASGSARAPKVPFIADVSFFHMRQRPLPTRYWMSNLDPVSVEEVAQVTLKGLPAGAALMRTGTFTTPRIPLLGAPCVVQKYSNVPAENTRS